MSLPLKFVAAIADDPADAEDWYETQCRGLSDAFYLQFETTLRRIREFPESYQLIHADARRALLHRFPYAIFYHMKFDFIEIDAVFHCGIDPHTLAARLDEPSIYQ